MSSSKTHAAVAPVEPGGPRPAPSLVPLHRGDAPFRSLLAIPEAGPGFPAEAKREVRASAVRRLEELERLHRQIVAQAQEIVRAARRDLCLHDVPVSATKIRGKSYHLYERPGRRPGVFFSILGPADYAAADPAARHLASYRLNEDSSWSLLEGAEDEPWLEVLQRGADGGATPAAAAVPGEGSR